MVQKRFRCGEPFTSLRFHPATIDLREIQMDVLVYVVSILLFAGLIPALLVAGYLRTRRKGYRPPAALLVLLVGIVAGIAEAYILSGRLPPQERGVLAFFVICWVPVLGSAATTGLLVRFLPRRNLRVFGQRRPRFPFATTGKALISLGVLICVFSFVWSTMGKAPDSVVSDSLKLLVFASAFGGYLIFLGRHISGPASLEEITRTDPRPPVLYLRPFSQESDFFVSGPKSRYGAYARGLQRFAMNLGESLGNDTALNSDPMVGIRFEEYFNGALKARVGPLFALGNPEDYTPPEGAVRTYATDADWKDYLDRIAKRSSCIVAEIASSDNMRWEFEYLRREGMQQKLFILTRPSSTANLSSRVFYKLVARLRGVSPVTWQTFAENLATFGYGLPNDPGPGAVITFDGSGKGVIVASGAHLPLDYVEPVRAFLIERGGYLTSQLDPPAEPELASPGGSTASAAKPKRSLLRSLVSAWGWVGILVLIGVWSFRAHIPVLRDLGMAGGADLRKANEFYNRQQYTEALPYFKRAAAAGNTVAMTNLGFMNEQGQGGLAQNDSEAAIWYRKAADANLPQAMVNLAVFYLEGRGGLPKDYAKAADLCRKAADANDPGGMLMLAAMYDDGIGLSKDSAAARDWYQKSADLGNATAKQRLKQLQDSSGRKR